MRSFVHASDPLVKAITLAAIALQWRVLKSGLVNAQPHLDIQGRSVLLAEDNLINQRVAKMMLCSLGMCCEVASNGQEAIDAVLRRIGREDICQFDVLLMDMAMPVMGGVDATKVCCCLFDSQCCQHLDHDYKMLHVQRGAGEVAQGYFRYLMAFAAECCIP